MIEDFYDQPLCSFATALQLPTMGVSGCTQAIYLRVKFVNKNLTSKSTSAFEHC